jgi:hypothetical protein
MHHSTVSLPHKVDAWRGTFVQLSFSKLLDKIQQDPTKTMVFLIRIRRAPLCPLSPEAHD